MCVWVHVCGSECGQRDECPLKFTSEPFVLFSERSRMIQFVCGCFPVLAEDALEATELVRVTMGSFSAFI